MTDNKPIIRLFFARLKESYHKLPKKEQQEFMAKDMKNLKELGCKIKMMIDCRWSSKDWHFIGIEEWPSLEVLQKRAAFEEEELAAYRYVESKTHLGTSISDEYTQM